MVSIGVFNATGLVRRRRSMLRCRTLQLYTWVRASRL
jgi:hypothetical protein